MSKQETGLIKKVFGTVCHHCPLCKYGRSHPDSMIGKILHHRLHAEHCPLWNAEKEIYGAPDEP